MNEYIKRKEAILTVRGYAKHSIDKGRKSLDTVDDSINMCDEIDRLPAADVVPVVHGRWVDRIVDENEVIQPWMKRYYCSECLEGGNQSWFKFCPNCGAKMDGDDSE